MNNDLFESLKALEMSLHNPSVRADKRKLAERLHPEFIEYGYSGKTWGYQSVVVQLLTEAATDAQPTVISSNYEYTQYSPAVVQVRYRSAHCNESGALHRHAKRSSIWVNETGQWQIKFHQATRVAEDMSGS